jgi:hypothetical protein
MRSLKDLSCVINCVGQTECNQIVSKRAASTGKPAQRSKAGVGDTFHPSFVRLSQAKKIPIGGLARPVKSASAVECDMFLYCM